MCTCAGGFIISANGTTCIGELTVTVDIIIYWHGFVHVWRLQIECKKV